MNIILDNVSQNREAWLERRRQAVTSSKIATICGFNAFESVFERWAKDTGKVPDDEVNDDMFLGSEMQPIIMKLLQRRVRFKLADADCLVQCPKVDWALASPDCWELPGDLESVERSEVPERAFGITELKNTNLALADRWKEDPPEGPTLQLTWQLGCCEKNHGHLAGMVGGSARRLKNFYIPFSAPVFEEALEAGYRYRQNVLQDIPPEAGPGDLRLVGALAGARVEESIDLSDNETAQELIARWQDYDRQYKEAMKVVNEFKTKRDGIKARFCQLMGNKIFARVGQMQVTAKETERQGYQVDPTSFMEVRIGKFKPIR
jgi:putative phage-type endonuclease